MFLRILRKILIAFYLSMGVSLLLSSYLVWKNNDLVPAMLGVALFLFAGIGFLAQGIAAIMKMKKKRRP